MIRWKAHPSSLHCKGFTFVEVLVALVMTTLLVTVASSSLIHAMRAEETARSLHESQFALQDIACASYMGLQPSNTMQQLGAEWTLDAESVMQKLEETNILWKIWRLTPGRTPSMKLSAYFRSSEEEDKAQ